MQKTAFQLGVEDILEKLAVSLPWVMKTLGPKNLAKVQRGEAGGPLTRELVTFKNPYSQMGMKKRFTAQAEEAAKQLGLKGKEKEDFVKFIAERRY